MYFLYIFRRTIAQWNLKASKFIDQNRLKGLSRGLQRPIHGGPADAHGRVGDDHYGDVPHQRAHRPLVAEAVDERTVVQMVEELGGDTARKVDAAERQTREGEVAGDTAVESRNKSSVCMHTASPRAAASAIAARG